MISLEKLKLLTPIQKLPRNKRDLGKLIVDKGFKKFPKVQSITQSGHTGSKLYLFFFCYFAFLLLFLSSFNLLFHLITFSE